MATSIDPKDPLYCESCGGECCCGLVLARMKARQRPTPAMDERQARAFAADLLAEWYEPGGKAYVPVQLAGLHPIEAAVVVLLMAEDADVESLLNANLNWLVREVSRVRR